MQAIHTPADPPNRGSRDLASTGCTMKRRAELQATEPAWKRGRLAASFGVPAEVRIKMTLYVAARVLAIGVGLPGFVGFILKLQVIENTLFTGYWVQFARSDGFGRGRTGLSMRRK